MTERLTDQELVELLDFGGFGAWYGEFLRYVARYYPDNLEGAQALIAERRGRR